MIKIEKVPWLKKVPRLKKVPWFKKVPWLKIEESEPSYLANGTSRMPEGSVNAIGEITAFSFQPIIDHKKLKLKS
jgi:hypothetical protein